MKDYERRERDQLYRRPNDTRETGGSKQKQEKPKEPKYIPKYHNYNPLPMSQEKALMMVENADVPPGNGAQYRGVLPTQGRDRKASEAGVLQRSSSPKLQDWQRRDKEKQVEEPRSKHGPSRATNTQITRNNAPTKGVIYTIAGGSSAGNSNRYRKRCARTMSSSRGKEFVLKVEEEEAISFNSSDRPEESGEMNDPIVIKLDIANFTVHKILVDSRSSADIIFKSVIDKMGLENIRLELVRTPLVDFGGSEVASLGMVELPVSMGDEPKRKTMMVKFLEVDTPFAYNVILGRSGLNLFRAVISTYHMKGEPGQKKRKVKEDAEPRPYEAEHLKLSDEFKVVQLSPDEPDKTTRIGASIKEKEMAMISFLRESMDVFAWSPSDFTGINPEVIVHKLNGDPTMRPVQQKQRSFGGDKNEII
ncbi:UNVERIFIED_CONTAM: hypothetical protein Sindi_1844700 [Sesamum indicum]